MAVQFIEKGSARYSVVFPSPLGNLTLVATEQALCAVLWEGDRPQRVPLPTLQPTPEHPVLIAAAQQLHEYFTGQRQRFDHLE